jgi:hypothetical protein
MRARLALANVVALGAAACGSHPPPVHAGPTDAGISLALYADGDRRYGIVDDRRWLDIDSSFVLLGNIDPGAALASLVIETANPAVRIGPCTRDRLPEVKRDALAEYGAEQERLAAERLRNRVRRPLPNVPPPARGVLSSAPRVAPIVRCGVSGPRGRQLVRIVYVSSTLTYRAQHDVEVTDLAHTTIDSRYAVETPPWRSRADVVLFDGIPGGERTPVELARGPITLDGGTGVLAIPRREVAARLRRVYVAGTMGDDPDAEDSDPRWLAESLDAVWVSLVLPGVRLSPGNVRIHVDLDGEPVRWTDIPAANLPRFEASDTRPLRLALWIDDTLRGATQRNIIQNDGERMIEAFQISVTNIGDTPREVEVEERVRAAKRRRVERPWPKKPSASGDVLRSTIEVKPGKTARAGYVVVYEL